MIPRAVFLQFPLQENSGILLSDIAFAYELKQNKVPVLHIDNPIVVRALLTNIRFLAQSRKDIRELAQWMKQIEPDDEIEESMSEYKKMKQLTKYRISSLFDAYFGIQASDKIKKMVTEGKTLKAYKQFREWYFLKEYQKK